jgi:hypothetical protein
VSEIWALKALTQEGEEDTSVGLGFIGLALVGKDIVFRFIIEYRRSLRDFGPY